MFLLFPLFWYWATNSFYYYILNIIGVPQLSSLTGISIDTINWILFTLPFYFKIIFISLLTFLFPHGEDYDDHSNHDPRKFQKGIISGIVVDSKTQDPIEYVSVSVKSLENNLVVNGGISDKDGYFYIHSNENAPDYQILRCKHDNISKQEVFIPKKEKTIIGGLDFLDDYIIRAEMSDAIPKIFIRKLDH